MTLFTEAELSLGVICIPDRRLHRVSDSRARNWTLVVNKNVTPGAAYDEKQDVARTQMESAQVDAPSDTLEVAFAHVQSRCTVRIYIGKTASFADFTAK